MGHQGGRGVAERFGIGDEVIAEAIVERRYTVEDRLTIDVGVYQYRKPA